LKVFGVIEGPIHSSDYDAFAEEDEWVVVCILEGPGGALVEEEVIFDTFDEAYEVVKHFKRQMKPIQLVKGGKTS
jgi:hypothetical protein